MPSTSNKQQNLMAACANGALYKKCPPLKVAREFTQADKGKKGMAGGGATPLESGMAAQLNFGQGHGHNFFSTTPMMGHAASGALKFAEGGEVKKPKGPSAKERREIRALIERGKGDAVDALRETRAALQSNAPEPAKNIDVSLDDLRARLAMKDGGEVQDPAAAEYADPEMLFQEYQDLMNQLQDPQMDAATQSQLIERLAGLGEELQSMGIDTDMMAESSAP